jgi:hypothetical protein
MRLPIGDVLGFATGATTPESLDSYKVRSNTIRRAQEVGLVRVTRYGKTAGYVASPELIDGLSEQARKLVALVDELHAARPLLVAATRLGIRPEDALAVLMPPLARTWTLPLSPSSSPRRPRILRRRRDAIRNVSSTTVVTTA